MERSVLWTGRSTRDRLEPTITGVKTLMNNFARQSIGTPTGDETEHSGAGGAADGEARRGGESESAAPENRVRGVARGRLHRTRDAESERRVRGGVRSALDVILSHLTPLTGLNILDVGCGSGRLGAKLEAEGALWRGLDPTPAPGARADIDAAGAEAMPYGDGAFDAAVVINALHHVPEPSMDAALGEIARVVKQAGMVVVVEPRADGALSRVLALVDDETEIRAAAQRAVDGAIASNTFSEDEAYDYGRAERFADFEAFAGGIARVDPSRIGKIAERRGKLGEAFLAEARRDGEGYVLDQPMSVRVLTRR